MKYQLDVSNSKGVVLTIWITSLYNIYLLSVTKISGQNQDFQEVFRKGATHTLLVVYLIAPLVAPFVGLITGAWFKRYSLFLLSIVIAVVDCVICNVAFVISLICRSSYKIM